MRAFYSPHLKHHSLTNLSEAPIDNVSVSDLSSDQKKTQHLLSLLRDKIDGTKSSVIEKTDNVFSSFQDGMVNLKESLLQMPSNIQRNVKIKLSEKMNIGNLDKIDAYEESFLPKNSEMMNIDIGVEELDKTTHTKQESAVDKNPESEQVGVLNKLKSFFTWGNKE